MDPEHRGDDAHRGKVFAAVLANALPVPEKIFTWDLGKMLEAHDEGVWYGEGQKLISQHMDPKYL